MVIPQGGFALPGDKSGAIDVTVEQGAVLCLGRYVVPVQQKADVLLTHRLAMHSSKGVAFPASKGMSVAEKPIMYLQPDELYFRKQHKPSHICMRWKQR